MIPVCVDATAEYSVDLSEVTYDIESRVTMIVDKASSGEEISVRSNGLSVIHIDNIRLVGDEVPARHLCYPCTTFGHNLNGRTTEVCTNGRYVDASTMTGHYVDYYVLTVNTLNSNQGSSTKIKPFESF